MNMAMESHHFQFGKSWTNGRDVLQRLQINLQHSPGFSFRSFSKDSERYSKQFAGTLMCFAWCLASKKSWRSTVDRALTGPSFVKGVSFVFCWVLLACPSAVHPVHPCNENADIKTGARQRRLLVGFLPHGPVNPPARLCLLILAMQAIQAGWGKADKEYP